MIAICGAGSWGTALAIALGYQAKKEVLLWGRDQELLTTIAKTRENPHYLPGITIPPTVTVEPDLAQAIIKAKDVIISIPSHSFSNFLQQIKNQLTKEHRIIWVTKGLEPVTGRFLQQVIAAELGEDRACAILSGPSFAQEVGKRLPTAVTVASNFSDLAQDLVSYFHCDVFRVYTSTDLIGVQLGGVIKNVFAVAAGISDGLGFGANARAALLTRGLSELIRLGLAMGAKIETLTGLSGVGDLILTCTDNQSRNRRFGLALASGISQETAQQQIGQVVEAVYNAKEIFKLSQKYQIEMPIIEQINLVLQKKILPLTAVQNLLMRKPKNE